MDSVWLHWSQTGRDASPAEFITAKVFVKYRGPIAGGELEELVCSPETGETSRSVSTVQVKLKGKVLPVQTMRA